MTTLDNLLFEIFIAPIGNFCSVEVGIYEMGNSFAKMGKCPFSAFIYRDGGNEVPPTP